MEIRIGNKIISMDSKPYFIADIAANHDGDLDRAYKLIELAKEAGADAAKFQNFKAHKIVSRKGFDTMEKQSHQAQWKKSVFEVYEEASVEDEWSGKLKDKCDEVGIEYMTSPYDFESVEHADSYVNAYKIGSGDITWIEMLEYIAKKQKPVLLATGAASMEEVEKAVSGISRINQKIVLMQCNTNYTASSMNMHYINLNVIKTYANRFPNCILGLSDHTFGHTTVVGGIALGARVIEKHFTDDNDRIGPDHKFSMTPKAWKGMVEESLNLWHSLGDGIKKVEENEINSRIVQQRAIYAVKEIKRGEVITREHLYPLRPIREGSILPYEMDKVIGKRAKVDILEDSYIKWEDLNDDIR